MTLKSFDLKAVVYAYKYSLKKRIFPAKFLSLWMFLCWTWLKFAPLVYKAHNNKFSWGIKAFRVYQIDKESES